MGSALYFQTFAAVSLLLVCSLVSLPRCRAFRPVISPCGRLLTTRLAAENGGGGLGLPFFASFPDEQQPDSGTAATVTTRLPLGTLFDSRDYIFTAATNVRSYEWTLRETDELFDDLTAAASGGPVPLPEGERAHDYELNQIVLVPLEWDTTLYGLGRRYGVYDGQQRLVTLCLLLAALRESLRIESDMTGTVKELTDMLNPPKVRKAPVLRIELSKRDDELLRRILEPELTQEVGGKAGAGGTGVRVDLPLPGSEERKKLSATSRRVLENYERLLDRVGDMSLEEQVQLLDYLVEHVYMLVCVPETARIARNIVMAQGKGMNNEPIDDFKGLVCFRYTRDEDDMYRTFDRWDELAAVPSDNGNGNGDAVGRDTVASACLLRASAALKEKIRKNDEVYALERWLRQDLAAHGCEGKDFFVREVEPAARALRLFRDGDVDTFRLVIGGKKSGDDELRRTTEARLWFLRGLAEGTASAKEVEMVILELLLRARGVTGRKRPSPEELDECLRGTELAALWMALVRPPPSRRHKLCLDLLDAIAADSPDGTALEAALPQEERSALRNKLVSFEFGATPTGRKVAGAVLERLNTHLLIRYSDGEMPEIIASRPRRVEHVLPTKPTGKYWDEHWPDQDDRDQWVHRLGNLVLLSRRSAAREANRAFGKKKERYKLEVWPLTSAVSAYPVWNRDALMEEQGKLLGLLDKVWGL